MIHRAFVLSLFLAPALALALRERASGIVVLVICWGLSGALFYLHRRKLLQGWSGSTPQSAERSGPLGGLDFYRGVRERVLQLKHSYEDARLRLVNTNIQLLSVRELWQALARPGRLEHTVDGALVYCHRASGFQEVMILRIERKSRELVGRWLHPGASGSVVESLRWSLGGLGGTAARAMRNPSSILVAENSSELLLTVNGESPAAFREHGAHLVVPLLTPLPRHECLKGGWLYHDDCPVFELAPSEQIRESFPVGEGGLDLHPCISCRHYPLYGLMVVTDRARPAGIRKADQLTLESLSYAVSAVLQNASLYHELEMGERFRDQILDGMSNGLITTDDRGRVIFINRRAQELLASSGRSLVGRKLDSLLWVPGVESPTKAALLGREPSLRWEGRMGLDSESSIPVLLTLAKYRREEGGLVGVIAVIEDLSAVHLMQEEIRHLDTLAAIGRFASSMAHEIRNPLGGISAGMDYLARKGAFDGEDSESVAVIQEEIQRLDGIIRNLFQVARPARLQKEETAATQTAQRVHRAIKDWAQERGVEIRIESEDALPNYHIDRDQIHQVLFNLLKNAVEVSRPGATVLLKLSKLSHASPKPVLEEAIAFEVIDQGPGIDREDLPHIFEPFYSKKADGTGLGLFVSHNIVERHGGVLQAFSEPGEGARIRILLPLAPTTIGSQS